MSACLENGRAAILAAVNEAFDQVQRDIHPEIEKDHQAELETRNGIIDTLRRENAELRAQLQELRSATPVASFNIDEGEAGSRTTPSHTAGPYEKTSPTEAEQSALIHGRTASEWKSAYSKMSAKFNALSSNFKKAKLALEKRRDERDRWVQHASWLEKKIKSAEQGHGIRILDHTPTLLSIPHPTGEPEVGADVSFTTGPADPESSEHCDKRSDDLVSKTIPMVAAAGDVSSDKSTAVPEDPEPVLPPITSNDSEAGIYIKPEPSSDQPMFVSERSVKRRRVDEDDSAEHYVKIKTEEAMTSSSPVTLDRSRFISQESLDLGDVAQRMMTPRKRKDLEAAFQARGHDQTDMPPPTPDDRSAKTSAAKNGLVRAPQFSSALTPVSVNQRWVKPAISTPKTVPLKKGLARGISQLAEDGFYGKISSRMMKKDGSVTISSETTRISSLLDSPCPPNDAAPALPQARNRSRNSLDTPRQPLSIPQRRELPFASGSTPGNMISHTPRKDAAGTGPKTPATTPAQMSAVQSSKKNSTPLLRTKRRSELRLDDFKINPRVNDGHDFAFSEVVRDKEGRACLPGCTDMHCCGKEFRALALSQRPDPPLTAAQRQDEQRLLEQYLGDYSYRLAGMTKAERAELWVEAKTQELADKYGKHRHRFSRMRSPPGFWNADFPSTQELEADKAEASKREKATIEERYREALRPGGRWMFRDE